MYDENQIVTTRWNNKYREWYESHGYKPLKTNELFNVVVKDLPIHSSVKITAVCDYCGLEYQTEYAILLNGRKSLSKDACSKCAGKKSRDISRNKRTTKQFDIAKEYCKLRGYTLVTTEDEYTNLNMKIKFICPKHGEQSMRFDNFNRGHQCIKCSYEQRGKELRFSTDYVKETIENINENILLNPEEYKDVFTRNLKIQCSCGNVFVTSFANYIEHNVNRCHVCSQKESVGEFKIRNFLEANDISFVQEKRFKNCRNIKPLPFDFYLPKENMIIEFDGLQHFQPVFSEDGFKHTKINDEIKNKYCEENDIKLIRIPYWEGDKIEEIISKELNIAI